MTRLVEVAACTICEGLRFKEQFSVNEWRIMQCECCGVTFTSPTYTDEYYAKLYETGYYDVAKSYGDQQILEPNEDHLRLASLARRLLRGRTLTSMDVGCGGGRIVEAFGEKGFKAEGIEPNLEIVASANKIGRSITSQRLDELPSGKYGCVTALHVLEHVRTPKTFLDNINRILVSNGLLIVEVPNFASKKALRLKGAWPPLLPDTHLFHFTPATLKRLLVKKGFKVRRQTRLGGAGVVETIHQSKGEAGNMSLLGYMWGQRLLLKAIPGATSLFRWVNWELLRNGEYIRVIAFKV